jgi:hypothetical protein
MLKDIYCPLTLNLGPDVEYELIARVLYSGSTSEAADTVGHYTTQTRIGDRSYVYNDLNRGGSLAELGPLNLLEDVNAQVVSVIYLRRSRSSVSKIGSTLRQMFRLTLTQTTTRSMAEIEEDCAKIPPLPPPSLVQDSDEEEQWIKDLYEIVMLPYPGATDWKADGVLWYPAKFIQRYQRSVGTSREFKFRWFECDWFVQHDPDALPHLIPQTYQNTREFCEAVSGIVLKSSQVCLRLNRSSVIERGYRLGKSVCRPIWNPKCLLPMIIPSLKFSAHQ